MTAHALQAAPAAELLEDAPDHLNHVLRKADILRSLVEGVAVTALCGVTFRVRPTGGGYTARRGLPTCAVCWFLHGQARAGEQL